MVFRISTRVYSFFQTNLSCILTFKINLLFQLLFPRRKHVGKNSISSWNSSRQFTKKTKSGINIVSFSIGSYLKTSLFGRFILVLHGKNWSKFLGPGIWTVKTPFLYPTLKILLCYCIGKVDQ
mgnify:CR=1 FL=1